MRLDNISDLIVENQNLLEKISISSKKIADLEKAATVDEKRPVKNLDDVYVDDCVVSVRNVKSDGFEREVLKYLDAVDSLDDSDDMVADIIQTLPFGEEYDTGRLLKRLILEFYRKIEEVKMVMNGSEEDSNDPIYLELLRVYQKKMAVIIDLSSKNRLLESSESVSNQLIFLKNNGGRIRILDEIEDMDKSLYPGLLSLFNSIIDGTFKGNQKYVNRWLNTIYEVKDTSSKTRILYDSIGNNCYVVIGVRFKDRNYDSVSRNAITNHVIQYNKVRPRIEEALDDEEFLAGNAEITKRLLKTLQPDNVERVRK